MTTTSRLVLRAILGVACSWLLLAGPVLGAPTDGTPAKQLLAQADKISSSDHQRFLRLLAQLHQRESELSPAQRQHLAFLDALEYDLQDDTRQAALRYQKIIDHPLDPHVVMRARVAYIALDLRRRKYLQAYTRANDIMEKLPAVTDPRVRVGYLNIIIRVLFSQEQYTRARGYARQMIAEATNAQERCLGRVFQTQARLYEGKSLASTRALYLKTIDTCQAAGTPGVANSLYPVWAGAMKDAGKSRQAIAYLKKHEPELQRGQFKLHVAVYHIVMAQAHLKLGQYAQAGASARAALAFSRPGSYRWSRMTAYKLLYRVARHDGDTATALAMHEKYMTQYKAYADDAKAQALAYQMVKQDMLASKMQLANLAKQNKILHLRQSLDRKSAENSRLYILLLLLVLFMIGLWAYRTKHSQLRFRRMARHDDLTDAFSRQHFLEQAEQTLHRLQKSASHACLLILDMDHFKRINDRYGHIHGDTVLQHVAATCRSELRDSDVFGRLGGEEFGILMPGCASAHGRDIGERIRLALLHKPVRITDHDSVTVTSSIGMACTGDYGYGLKRLLARADDALYEAKRGGRNRLVVSSSASGMQAPA